MKKANLRILILNLILILIVGLITFIFISDEMYIEILLLVLVLIVQFITTIAYIKNMNSRQKEVIALSYRIESVGREVFDNLPIGIITYNNFHQVEWANKFAYNTIPKLYVGEHLKYIMRGKLYEKIDLNAPYKIDIDNYTVKVVSKAKQRVVYLFDDTNHEALIKKYIEKKTTIGMMQLDNYEELLETVTETEKAKIGNQIVHIISSWAEEHGIFLKGVSIDRYMLVFENSILENLILNNFDILNKVRKKGEELDMPITLSIGLAKMEGALINVGNEANKALDFAVSRGGDQVALKINDRPLRFFGGKTESFAKRNRTRTRMLAHNLSNLMAEANKVLIMPHKYPDADALGSAIAIAKIAKTEELDFKIVISPNEETDTINKMIKFGKTDSKNIFDSFITPDKSIEYIDEKTLLVVVDTHNPNLVVEPSLIEMANNIVVIDHHRRGKDFINEPTLLHQEPYASSTVELVVELVEYYPKMVSFTAVEATLLLTGIIVDTKSFTFRTGARTFEAAALLRKSGADMIKVQTLLREDIDNYINKAKMIENVIMFDDCYAIVKANDDVTIDKILLAQTADSLLMVDEVKASFAMGQVDEKILISARSLGEVNVQIIMEKLNGGGHLNNAATAIGNKTMDEVYEMLIHALKEYEKEE